MPAADDDARGRTALLIAVAAAAVLAVVTYLGTLGHPFVYDDNRVVVANPAAQASASTRTTFLTASWAMKDGASPSWRPFPTWTFAVDQGRHGTTPYAYHVVNVAAHAVTAGLVVLLASAAGLPVAGAALAGALFAVHPVGSEAVAHVAGRADVLCALFVVLALVAHLGALRGGTPVLVPVAGIATALACLSGVQGLTVFVLAPLADLALVDRRPGRRPLRNLGARRLALYSAILLATVTCLILRRTALAGAVPAYWENPAASAPAPLRLLAGARATVLALGLLVAPVNLSADYTYRQLLVPGDLGDAAAALAVLAAVLLLALGLWRSRRAWAFWLLLSLVALGAVSNVALPLDAIFRERWLYLPAVGIAGLVAALLSQSGRGVAQVVGIAVGLVAVVVASLHTMERNRVWAGEKLLALATIEASPDSVQAHRSLGIAYMSESDDHDALDEFKRAIALNPDDVVSLYHAGSILQRAKSDIGALGAYRHATEVDPTFLPAWLGHAQTNLERGSPAPALSSADRAVALRPDLPHGYISRGYALDALDRPDEARAAFDQAVRVAPNFPDALIAQGSFAGQRGDWPAAVSAFERLTAIAPSPDAYGALVTSYRNAGRNEDADRAAAAARQRFPDAPGLSQ